MLIKMSKTAVFVELTEVGSTSTQNFEIILRMDVHNPKPDIALVLESMVAKKPSLSGALRTGELSFKIECKMFPGRLSDFGENSSVKHKSVLKRFLSRRESLAQSLASGNTNPISVLKTFYKLTSLTISFLVGNTNNYFMGMAMSPLFTVRKFMLKRHIP